MFTSVEIEESMNLVKLTICNGNEAHCESDN